jgi:prolyl-tRNA synthetase
LEVSSGTPLKIRRAIEVGHVFKLGTKYSEALGARFLDTDGQQKPCIMGCYGIGVTRTLQAAIEQSFDANGIVWPVSLAPAEVEVMAINAQHAESVQIAEQLVKELEALGLDVMYDDRDERAGVKFKDADLLGAPVRICVGERSLAKGAVEFKLRKGGQMDMIPVAEAVSRAQAVLAEMKALLQP